MNLINSARQSQVFQENSFNKAPVRRIDFAMNANFAITGSYTENPFWYQQLDLRQIKLLRVDQPFVDFDAADNCPLHVTRMNEMNVQYEVPSILCDNFKKHFLLVFDFTSMQTGTEKCHYPELVGEPIRLELNFTFPPEHVFELIVLGERLFSVADDKVGLSGKKIEDG